MEKRNRKCENGVHLSYLECLHIQYENLMYEIKNHADVQVYFINGNQNEQQVFSDVCSVINNYKLI